MNENITILGGVEKSLDNQKQLEKRVNDLEAQNLSLQEATATMYEEQSAYKLQMQEAIATLYEQLLVLSEQSSEEPIP